MADEASASDNDDHKAASTKTPKKPKAQGKKKSKNVTPRCKAATKRRTQTEGEQGTEASAKSTQHAAAMKRLRTAVRGSKEDIRKQYNKISKLQKQEWAKQYDETKNFDWVITKKSEARKNMKKLLENAEWMTSDGLLLAEGWSESNQHSEFGQRAAARALAIETHCKKLGKKFVKKHRQHGEYIYPRLTNLSQIVKEHEKCIATEVSKEGKVDEAENQKGATSSSSGFSSMSESDADDTDDEDDPEPKKGAKPNANAAYAANQIGACVAMDEAMKKFDPHTHKWLEPWKQQLEDVRKALAIAKETFTTSLSASVTDKHTQDGEQALQAAQALNNILQPVWQTMEQAVSKTAVGPQERYNYSDSNCDGDY